MNDSTFDAFAHRAAAGISRRRSLITFGGVGVAALAGPMTAQSKKSGKKAKQRCKKNINQKCQKQVPQCQALVTSLNGNAAQVACCDFLAICDFASLNPCLIANDT